MPDHSPQSARSARRVAGLVLLILAPLCVAGAVAYSLIAPRVFSAFTEFQLTKPQADSAGVPAAWQAAQKDYATRMQGESLAEEVRIESLGVPGKYRITATDRQPIRAMYSANGLTLLVRDRMRKEDDDLPPPLTLLAKAEMPKTPSGPNVRFIMQVGICGAILCAVAGVALRRASRVKGAPADRSSREASPVNPRSGTGDY